MGYTRRSLTTASWALDCQVRSLPWDWRLWTDNDFAANVAAADPLPILQQFQPSNPPTAHQIATYFAPHLLLLLLVPHIVLFTMN